MWDFLNLGGTLFEVPIIGIVLLLWGLYWGSRILGTYHIPRFVHPLGLHHLLSHVSLLNS